MLRACRKFLARVEAKKPAAARAAAKITTPMGSHFQSGKSVWVMTFIWLKKLPGSPIFTARFSMAIGMTPPSSTPKNMVSSSLTVNWRRRETDRPNWLSATPILRSSATAVQPMTSGITSHRHQNKSVPMAASVFR